MTRKKLPAYGAALMDRRRRGIDPLCVHVIYGFKWRAELLCRWSGAIPGVHPLLAVRPPDYAPGVYDFSVLLGLRACVFDQEGAAAYYESPDLGPARPQFCRFYELVGEIAKFAAVDVASPALEKVTSAQELAFCMRRASLDPACNHGWPHWWSAQLEEKNGQRRNNWLLAVGELRAAAAVCA